MKIAIESILDIDGIVKISAGNFNGALGEYNIKLLDLFQIALNILLLQKLSTNSIFWILLIFKNSLKIILKLMYMFNYFFYKY